MREKSPRSNLRKRLLILRKKLERTASFPKKLFLGISPRRLILPPNSLRAAPAGAASKTPLPPTKKNMANPSYLKKFFLLDSPPRCFFPRPFWGGPAPGGGERKPLLPPTKNHE